MADIKELIRLLKELEKDLSRCTRCGMCQSVCPLYTETGRETDVARGKIVLVENLEKEILDDPAGIKQRLDRCLLCGSCEAVCPAGVPLLDIFLKSRAIITGYLGLSPLKKAVFRSFLSNPDRFDRMLKWVSGILGTFSKDASQIPGSSCAGLISPIIGDRHFVPIASEPWHVKNSRQFAKDEGGKTPRVVFYPGCLTDKVLTRVADAAMKIFDYHGINVFIPSRVPCCGIPALSAGDRETFENLIKYHMDILYPLDYDFIVTPCATCTSTIRKIWPSMSARLSGELRKKILSVSGRTLDINEFIADTLGVRASDDPAPQGAKTVTYHDPCHLKKSLGIARQPRTVLLAAGNINFREMRDPDKCCGMGGSFNLENYELSRKIGENKLKSILESGADEVATGCPACMLQIIDLLSHAGRSIPVKHSAEIYAESLTRGFSVCTKQPDYL